MQISSRFMIAIHIFSRINTFEKENKITLADVIRDTQRYISEEI